VPRDHADVFILNIIALAEFLPCTELILLPAWEVEIFIEYYDGADLQSPPEFLQDVCGAGIEIAIDVQECHIVVMLF